MPRLPLSRPMPPLGASLTYQRVLRRAVAERQSVLLGDVLDRWEHRRTHGRIPHERQDARRIAGLPIRVEHSDIAAIGKRVATQNADELGRVIGVPARSLGLGVEAQIEHWRSKNVDLIKSLGDQELDRIEDLLDTAERGAWRVEELRKAIQSEFDVTKSKADLLARDQTLKLNAQISKHRQTSVGITQYTWSGSLDERERPEHLGLEGTTQDWNDPPVTNENGDRNHPGEDYQCRCVPIPILPWEADDAPDEPEEPDDG